MGFGIIARTSGWATIFAWGQCGVPESLISAARVARSSFKSREQTIKEALEAAGIGVEPEDEDQPTPGM